MQGFASGDLEGDAAAVRLFADAGLEMLLAQVSRRFWLCGKKHISHCTLWMQCENSTHLTSLPFLIFYFFNTDFYPVALVTELPAGTRQPLNGADVAVVSLQSYAKNMGLYGERAGALTGGSTTEPHPGLICQHLTNLLQLSLQGSTLQQNSPCRLESRYWPNPVCDR